MKRPIGDFYDKPHSRPKNRYSKSISFPHIIDGEHEKQMMFVSRRLRTTSFDTA